MFENSVNEKKEHISLKDYRTAVDFSALSPLLTRNDIEKVINITYKNRYKSLCVLPSYVALARQIIKDKFENVICVGTVINFPLGASVLATKLDEIKRAFADGADYIDCVINLAFVKNGEYAMLKKEISRMVRCARKHEIKVIIETSALTRDEIEKVCKICVKCKVDYIMTSTGFGAGGACPEIVQVIKSIVSDKIKIKASGGVATKEDVWNLIRAGAERIGTSREV